MTIEVNLKKTFLILQIPWKCLKLNPNLNTIIIGLDHWNYETGIITMNCVQMYVIGFAAMEIGADVTVIVLLQPQSTASLTLPIRPQATDT